MVELYAFTASASFMVFSKSCLDMGVVQWFSTYVVFVKPSTTQNKTKQNVKLNILSPASWSQCDYSNNCGTQDGRPI